MLWDSLLPVRDVIAKLEKDITSLRGQLAVAQEELEDVTRLKRLLYETGEGVLEPIVLEALRALGGIIELPKQSGKEDGRLVDPGDRSATLEIKGRSGTLRLSDVRQAHQWVADSIAYEERESKCILIANLHRDKSPADRGEVFPSNCVKAARNFDICLLTTTQLFNAVGLHQSQQLDLRQFWDSLFEARGICSFQELG